MHASEHDSRELHRSAIWLLVIVCHVIVLRFSWLQTVKRDAARNDSALVLLPALPAVEQTRTTTSTANKSAVPVRQKPAVPLAEQHTDRVTEAPSIDTALAIDWQTAAEAAAREAGQASTAQPTMRSFGNASSSSSTGSISLHESPHKRGDQLRYDDGTTQTYVSKNCFLTRDMSASQFREFAAGIPDRTGSRLTCRPPPAPDLSDELKDWLSRKHVER